MCIHYVRMRNSADCAAAEWHLVASQWRLFEECWPLVALYLSVYDWKGQRFCWPKTWLECVKSIYVKTTGAVCVSEELFK